jgi:phospholipase/lecithinase/hemolysin
VIVGTLRQCRALNDDIEQALARWEMRPSAHAGSSPRSSTTASPEALGPLASEWLRSDLHQVAGGDKDRVRGFVQRLEAAGAITIHVGTITDLGMTRIAGELLVVLHTEATRRAAVLEVHQSMLRATYGQFAPQSQAEGELLRVTL